MNSRKASNYRWLMFITHNISVQYFLVSPHNLQLLFLIQDPIGWLSPQIIVKNVKISLISLVNLKLIHLLQWNQSFKFMVVLNYQVIFTLILSVSNINLPSQQHHYQEVLYVKKINLPKKILVYKIFNSLLWTGWKACIKVFKEF